MYHNLFKVDVRDSAWKMEQAGAVVNAAVMCVTDEECIHKEPKMWTSSGGRGVVKANRTRPHAAEDLMFL